MVVLVACLKHVKMSHHLLAPSVLSSQVNFLFWHGHTDSFKATDELWIEVNKNKVKVNRSKNDIFNFPFLAHIEIIFR